MLRISQESCYVYRDQMDVVLNSIPCVTESGSSQLGRAQACTGATEAQQRGPNVQNLLKILNPEDKAKKPLVFINYQEMKLPNCG
mmetsp:Transcript_7465/g.12624  ORF Transcript_7465/g.12624 Transcript_7465/m.12624 type:complete len:85 (-) Transcript_7465:2148-2402(-)